MFVFSSSKFSNLFCLSETDKRIIELNQQGHSISKISKLLRMNGIALSKSSVRRHLTELRQVIVS